MNKGHRAATIFRRTTTEEYSGNKLLELIRNELNAKFTTEEDKKLAKCILDIVKVGIDSETKKVEKVATKAKKSAIKQSKAEKSEA